MVELRARFDEEANIRLARTHGGRRRPGRLRLRRAENPRQALPRRPPRGRRHAQLRPFRHRQLPPHHRPHLHRPQLLHLRPRPLPRQRPPVQLHDRLRQARAHGRLAFSPLTTRTHPDRTDRRRDRLRQRRQARHHLAQDEQPRRRPADRPALRTRPAPACTSCASSAASAACAPASPACPKTSASNPSSAASSSTAASSSSATASACPAASASVYISSADWMARNMDWRVETLVPIHNRHRPCASPRPDHGREPERHAAILGTRRRRRLAPGRPRPRKPRLRARLLHDQPVPLRPRLRPARHRRPRPPPPTASPTTRPRHAQD